MLPRLLNNLNQIHELNPLEKCFVHTDKKFYQPGEKIWFVAYLLLNDKPSSLSKVVYTDLSDNNGNLIAKDMWQVQNGTTQGIITLPDTLKTGIYRLRSYSLWMLNEPHTIGEQYLFIQGKAAQHKSFQPSSSNLKVSFFPESGLIAQGVANRVAFRVTDAFGLPQKVDALRLLEDLSPVLAELQIYDGGLGIAVFTPSAGKKYSIEVSKNGLTASFSLPPVAQKAITLQVANFSATRIFIQLNATDEFIQDNKQVRILALQQGKPVFQSVFQLEEGQNATLLPKKGLSEDLLQVIVIDQKHQVIAQRWIQVHIPSEKGLSVDKITLSAKPKESNHLQLKFKGIDTPNISVSIIPADLPDPDYLFHPNILYYTKFTSNNRTPAVITNYIDGLSDSAWLAYSDALMMTLNTERFSWKEINDFKLSNLNYFYETGISVRGFVKKEKNISELGRVDIITKGIDSTTILSTVTPDQRGAFAVNDLGFRKRASIYAQGASIDKKKRKLDLQLLPGYIDTLRILPKPAFIPTLEESVEAENTTEAFLKQYAVSGIGKSLDEIVITGKRKPRIDSLNEAHTTDLYRLSDYTFELDSNFSYATIWQALMELVPGLYVSSATANEPMVSFNRYTLTNDRIAGDDGTNSVAPVPIAFFLNEVPVNLFEISSVNPSDVALIKVNRSANLLMNSGSMYSGAEGSILIYTKKNSGAGRFSFDEASLTGYSLSIPFVQPNYEMASQRNNEDRRTTLFWNPQVKWKKDGTADILFYNNDYASKFKIVIQGVDATGKLYFLEKILE
ncbi:MAG: hypothetical protein FJX94_04820 [Bacteroidetes bacterium]|nr:hypothetical protein [Bacteroidota bacterium]